MFFSTLFTVDVSLFTLLFIPHLRRSSPHLPLHFFALSVHVHLWHMWHLSTFCLLPHSYQPNPFPIIVQSPHLYIKSQTEEAPERAKRLSPISRLCLIFYKFFPLLNLSFFWKVSPFGLTWSLNKGTVNASVKQENFQEINGVFLPLKMRSFDFER